MQIFPTKKLKIIKTLLNYVVLDKKCQKKIGQPEEKQTSGKEISNFKLANFRLTRLAFIKTSKYFHKKLNCEKLSSSNLSEPLQN